MMQNRLMITKNGKGDEHEKRGFLDFSLFFYSLGGKWGKTRNGRKTRNGSFKAGDPARGITQVDFFGLRAKVST